MGLHRLGTSIARFIAGNFGAFAFAAAAISDPLHWLKAGGVVSDLWHWDVSQEVRQALFAGCAFAWMFVWYHRQRIEFEENKTPTPNMPLHCVARYIARDSIWAANYPSQNDDRWVIEVDGELMSKLTMGHVYAFGAYRPDNHAGYSPVKDIPFAFLEKAEWNSHHLVTTSPPTHMWRSVTNGGGVYKNVMLDRDQVERAWPKRSWWQKLHKRSPIERINKNTRPHSYDAIFEKQDQNYKLIMSGKYPDASFDVSFEEASHAV